MSETSLLVLVDVVQPFTDRENAVLVFLCLLVQLAQVLLAQRTFKEVGVLDSLFFRA